MKMMQIKKHYGKSVETFKVIGKPPAPIERQRTKTLEDYKNEMFAQETEEQRKNRLKIMQRSAEVRKKIEEVTAMTYDELQNLLDAEQKHIDLLEEYKEINEVVQDDKP